jgi:hypothetical protein
MFRLRQKHSRNLGQESTPVDAKKLIGSQSVRAAIIGAATATIIFNVVWVFTAVGTGKFFPWFSILQGAAIGRAVQKYGRGFDWRFPLIAGVAAWTGAFSGNLLVALVFTVAETGGVGRGWWEILRSFYLNTISAVDVIYAICASLIAAYYSKIQLSRHDVLALRKNAAERHDKR